MRPFILEILGVQKFPEIKLTPESDILYPYDVTAWSLPIQMGILCEKIDNPFQVEMERINTPLYADNKFPEKNENGYAISHQYNNTTIAINRFLTEKIDFAILQNKFTDDGVHLLPGTIIIPSSKGIEQKLKSITTSLHLPVIALKNVVTQNLLKMESTKIGLYKPWRASMDEGWTRWLLEQYEFKFQNIHNEHIKKGNLHKQYDVIIIPDIDKKTIMSPKPKDSDEAKFYQPLPPEYEGGIKQDGIKHLKQFVENGGTLITFDSGCMLPIDEFPLPVANVLEKCKREEFYAPGVMLNIMIDTNHPIGWGMPPRAAAFFKHSPAFKSGIPSGKLDRQVVAYYPDEPLLQSGWIIGEKLLYRTSAIIEYKYSKGKIILIGFRVQHRAQPHGTFKLLFNSIHSAGISK